MSRKKDEIAVKSMGNFYTNVTLKGVDTGEVADTMRQAGRSAFVAQAGGDCVVYDAQADEQDAMALQEVAEILSRQHRCVALAAMNHDEDIFSYFLFEKGQLIDQYISNPDFFGHGNGGDRGGDVELLCKTLGRPHAVKDVRHILYEKEFPLSSHCYGELSKALGLPACAVGHGFNIIESNGPRDELQEWDVR